MSNLETRLNRLATTLAEIESLKPLRDDVVTGWFDRLEVVLVNEIVLHAADDKVSGVALYLKAVRELRSYIKTMLEAERSTLTSLEKLKANPHV